MTEQISPLVRSHSQFIFLMLLTAFLTTGCGKRTSTAAGTLAQPVSDQILYRGLEGEGVEQAPVNLDCSLNADKTIACVWQLLEGAQPTQFLIQRKLDNGEWESLPFLSAKRNAFSDNVSTHLSTVKTFLYRVYAINAVGESAPSDYSLVLNSNPL